MVRWKLSQLMGRYQMETGERLTLAELAAASGISRSSVTMAVAGQSKRVDLETVDRLLAFFENELGQTVSVADLLEYVPKN